MLSIGPVAPGYPLTGGTPANGGQVGAGVTGVTLTTAPGENITAPQLTYAEF